MLCKVWEIILFVFFFCKQEKTGKVLKSYHVQAVLILNFMSLFCVLLQFFFLCEWESITRFRHLLTFVHVLLYEKGIKCFMR